MYGKNGPARVRREDPEVLRGDSQYTDDLPDEEFPDMAHAAVCRSQYGHADIRGVDTGGAEDLEGVIAVLTAEDLAESDATGTVEIRSQFGDQLATEFPILAGEKVRFGGDAVAVVVAEDRRTAQDGADLVSVDYDRRESVTDVDEALAEDAPAVHESIPDNRIMDWEFGDEAATEAAFAEADTVVELEMTHQRLAPNPLEPRAAIGDYDAEADRLTFYTSTQSPHMDKHVAAEVLDMPADRIRVRAPDVGGGFGAKGPAPKAGELIAAWCSVELGRPVKWVANRTENIMAGPHGRDARTDAQLAVDDDGRVRGLRVDLRGNVGAYLVWGLSNLGHTRRLISGAYDIPAISGRAVNVLTNTAPIAPYRGAGRPEANYIVERLIDRAADELDIDPAEIRRRNFVPEEAFPFETAVGTVYDSGDYERALDLALETIDYDGWRERQADLREESRYIGIGLGSFVENTGTPGAPEFGRVRLDGSGTATAHAGTCSHGQGHATAFSQVVADELGIDYEDVDYSDGDTDQVSGGVASFASRSGPQGSGAVAEAASEVRERAREVAADHFETRVEDVEFDDGEFYLSGAPDRSIAIQEVARMVEDGEGPDGIDSLEVEVEHDMDGYAFTFGTHATVVEIDPDSGELDILAYVAVDDCGTQLNPLIVEGQVHGGVAQGLEEALYGDVVYDDNGTLVTGSLQDYTLVKSHHVPDMETEETVTPSPNTWTGAKGTGESGTIAAPPAIANAVIDALEPFGVDHMQKPFTDQRIWQAIHEATGGSGSEAGAAADD